MDAIDEIAGQGYGRIAALVAAIVRMECIIYVCKFFGYLYMNINKFSNDGIGYVALLNCSYYCTNGSLAKMHQRERKWRRIPLPHKRIPMDIMIR